MNEARTAAATTDLELADYLRDRDVPCPSCKALLRGRGEPVCPSCGMALTRAMLESAPKQPVLPPIVFVRILAAIAFLVAAYLTFTAITHKQPAGCSPGGGCGDVLSSPWSSLWGVPVSVPGLAVYLGIFIATFLVSPSEPDAKRRDAWTVLLALSAFAGLGAVWFVYLQIVVIKAVCPYCMIDHACGLLIAALVFYSAPIKRGEPLARGVESTMTIGGGRAGALVATTFVIVALFALAQDMFRAPQHKVIVTGPDIQISKDGGGGPAVVIDGGKDSKTPVGPKDGEDSTKDKAPAKDAGAPLPPAADPFTWLRLPKGPPPSGLVRLQRDAFPVRGDVNAPYLFVCLVDYTCPHCRAFHHLLEPITERYGNQIGFMLLPLPLNSDCNRFVQHTDERHRHACDLARLALAVWKTDPSKFAEYDDWLFQPEVAREAGEAKSKAEELVGKEALAKTFATGWAHEQILKTEKVYDLAGQGRVPKVMFNNVRIEGPIEAKDFFELVEKREGLNIQPRSK